MLFHLHIELITGFSWITIYRQLVPVLCVSSKVAGKRRDGTKRLLMNLIKLNKHSLSHGHFAVFDVSRSKQTALILSTDQSLRSASGALPYLIFTVKSTLNYSLMLVYYGLKKKKQTDPDEMLLYVTSDQDLHCLGIISSNLQPYWTKK